SFLKLSTVFGATSGQNSAIISPSLVLITATSFVEFIGFFSSALTDATTSAAASKLIRIDFMTICGTSPARCHASFPLPTNPARLVIPGTARPDRAVAVEQRSFWSTSFPMTERRMLEASLRISRNQSPAPLLSVALTLTTPRTIATPDGMKTSLVIPLVILFASQAAAQIVLDEHFTDGTLSFGSDPNDGNFLRQGGTSQTIGIVTDNVIGGGNALAYSNQTNGTLFIGQMQTPATLVFV